MIYNLIQQNRSYRKYIEDKRVAHEELVKLVELARLCPSAANLQPIRYYLIHEKQDCELIFPHLKWASYLRYWNGPEPGERPSAYILMLTPVNTTKFHHIDTGIAAQSILLGAVAHEMGGCMLASVDKPLVHTIFELPADLEIILVIAIGYPAENVVIDDIVDPEDVEYWRDEEGTHHVPKRRLQELILNY